MSTSQAPASASPSGASSPDHVTTSQQIRIRTVSDKLSRFMFETPDPQQSGDIDTFVDKAERMATKLDEERLATQDLNDQISAKNDKIKQLKDDVKSKEQLEQRVRDLEVDNAKKDKIIEGSKQRWEKRVQYLEADNAEKARYIEKREQEVWEFAQGVLAVTTNQNNIIAEQCKIMAEQDRTIDADKAIIKKQYQTIDDSTVQKSIASARNIANIARRDYTIKERDFRIHIDGVRALGKDQKIQEQKRVLDKYGLTEEVRPWAAIPYDLDQEPGVKRY